MRALLLLFLGAILFRMISRLLSTVQSALPGDEDEKKTSTVDKDKIIDAEFEDLDKG